MEHARISRRTIAALYLAAALVVPQGAQTGVSSPPLDAFGDDLFLLTTSVSPNVMLLLDNSDSMNHIEWHPAFDPDAGSYGCSDFDPDQVYRHDEVTHQTVFDGIDDYVSVPHNDAWKLDNGTVSLWFMTSDHHQDGTLFSKDSSGFDSGGHLTIKVTTTSHVQVRFQSATTSYFVESTSAYLENSWHHVAFTFGSGGMELWVDGTLVDTDPYTGGTGSTSGGTGSDEPIAIGAGTTTSGNLTVFPLTRYFEGEIDEAAIFDSALTPAEIQNIESAGLPNADIDPYKIVGAVHCGNTRTIWAPNDPTYWDGRYLNWYFSDDADAYYSEIQTAVAQVEGCTQAGGSGDFADKYRRTRFQAAKQVLLDLLCVAETKNVRFGLAVFRAEADAGGVDPNGAVVVIDLGRGNPNHAAELEAALKTITTIATDGTPLGESLFTVYTFWMSRDSAELPSDDQDGDMNPTTFPAYHYDKFGNWEPGNSNKWLEDALEYQCEKAFIIVVTDGQPTRDDFDRDPTDTSQGFDDYMDLIGDYYAPVDPVTLLSTDPDNPEVPGNAEESAYYLDDIAKYMYENDFRPVDLAGDQTIDTYAVGFAADAATNAYLSRAAELGNGVAYAAKDGDQLTLALIAALNNIIEKTSSFTAATVPSARTNDGADFYQSFFLPSGKSAFWEGHVRAWHINAAGEVLDKNDNCALADPTPGECDSGTFLPEAEFFWDAADNIPPPGTSNAAGVRQLYVSKSPTANVVPPAFDLTLSAADLDVQIFTTPGDPAPNSALYPVVGSTAINEEGLADEIVAFARGCFFGSGVVSADVATPQACLSRPFRLADIFHSNPVMVRNPSLRLLETSYEAFKSHYDDRSRVMYAGTNGGFLEAIDAGAWDSVNEVYTAGSGVEIFGFMPWEARTKIKNFPIDPATARTHYVDGDATVSDVWFYPSATSGAKNPDGSEWHTLLVGALREGGHHWYALDVTNPDGVTGAGGSSPIPYPAYRWEFPDETDTANDLDLIGETWSRPILTKIKLKVGADDNGGAGYERDVVVVTGGYDGESDPNEEAVTGRTTPTYAGAGTHGRSVFILDAKTGKVIAEKKFDAGASDATADMKYSIVGAPAVFDLDYDGKADVIYFVDMGGQVFKWVINPIGEDRANDVSGLRTQPNWPFKLFFTANIETDGSDTYYKNLFHPPAGAIVGGKLWLAFGSGERRNLAYAGDGKVSTDEQNRFYVVKDPDPLERAAVPIGTLDETDLMNIDGDEDGAAVTSFGYFFRAADGEKFVTNVEIFAGHVIVASFTPSPPGTDPCTGRGTGILYAFGITNGKGFFTDGSANPTRGLDIGAGLPSDPKVSVGVGGTNNKVIIEKSGADIEIIEEDDVNVNGGLLYWRER